MVDAAAPARAYPGDLGEGQSLVKLDDHPATALPRRDRHKAEQNMYCDGIMAGFWGDQNGNGGVRRQ